MSRSFQGPKDPAYYIENCWILAQVISKAALVSLVLSSLALRSLSWGPARAQSAFPLNIAHSRVGRALV